MKVINRSDGIVTYHIPELNVRRVFERGAVKDLKSPELTALYQMAGGQELLEDSLMVDDKEWVNSVMGEQPLEYYWNAEKIKNVVLEEDLDTFLDALDFAPAGVIDLIKYYSWKCPATDMNKIKAIQERLGFNPIVAHEIMKSEAAPSTQRKERRRKEG